MRNTALLEYDIGQSDWNLPEKQDYISIAEWMKSKCVDGNSICTIEASYPNGCSTTFSLDEFKKNFSSSSAYENICIHLTEPDILSFSCTFHPHKSARSISVLGESITSAETEDLAQSLKSIVEQLYEKHEAPPLPQARPSQPAEMDMPAKVEVTLSETEHSRLDEKESANSKWDKRRLAVEIIKDILIAVIGGFIAKLL